MKIYLKVYLILNIDELTYTLVSKVDYQKLKQEIEDKVLVKDIR